MDNLTPEQRRRNMAGIRSRHTKPEMLVRSMVHGLGFRFRLHDPKLPGKPDIVLTRHRKIILVHGCFWHMHSCKRGNVTPKTSIDYWQNKRSKNANRDKTNLAIYRKAGWGVLAIWECEIRDSVKTQFKLNTFLNSETNEQR